IGSIGTSEGQMRVGFIGLGMMGKGMAANLQKAGHQLTVYDLHRAAAEPFLAKGAEWANSPRAVAEASEVIFTSLPVPADVEAVGDRAKYIGPLGAATIAKLVHNCTSAVMNVALAEVFTMGIKAGVDPLELWQAVRQGATGRARTFDRLGKFLAGAYDPADF